ncbi:Uncharacterised protein [Klebsiella pneumoniae]|nr:Uncharacterised protein [Klebsiella pneumoniae]
MLAGERHLFFVKVPRPDRQFAFGKGLGDIGDDCRRDAGLFNHLRLGGMHLVQAGQKLRTPGRILLQALHPARRQTHRLRTVRRAAARHQRLHLLR